MADETPDAPSEVPPPDQDTPPPSDPPPPATEPPPTTPPPAPSDPPSQDNEPPPPTPPPPDVAPPAPPPPQDIEPPPMPPVTPPTPDGTPPPTPGGTPPTAPGVPPPPAPGVTPPATPRGTPPPAPRGTPPLAPNGTPPPTPSGMPPPTPGGTSPPTPGGTSPPPPADVPASPSPLSPGADTLKTSPSSKSGSGTAVVMGATVGGVVLLVLVGAIFFFVYRRRRDRRRLPPPGTPADFFYDPRKPMPTPLQQSHAPSTTPSSTPPPMQSWQSGGSSGSHGSSLPAALTGGTFSYDELAAATDGFSEANLLGQGGFGHVYKGTVRDGQEVAIKKLRAGSGQGHREFRAEVDIISRVHHKNLVSLVGFCLHADQRLLVYEYVPNNTLHEHLHPGSGRPALDWPRRWKIAVGSAKGLAYLHEDCHPKIIHRDIKAANILLDYSFEPKVADFGLAKCQEAEHTTVSTRVMGTYGYLAPEYAATGKVSDRSDVFSFGVMLLELITGRKPAIKFSDHDEPETLVSWARPLLARAVDEGNYEELIDPALEGNYDAYDMTRLVACAAAAVRHTARSRPRMTQIVRYLEGELSLEDLNAGMVPGRSAMQQSMTRSGGGTTAEVRRLRKTPFGTGTGTVSGEYTSSEISEPTSEYGLNPSSEYTASSAADTAEMRTGATTGMNATEVGRR